MEFLVKLISVKRTRDNDAREDLYANCTHVVGDLWLFEGDEDSLNEGIKFEVLDEKPIEGTGDLDSDEILKLVNENYNVDLNQHIRDTFVV